ncbi:MAG: class II aldolase/adducin family protein [Alphaproteobacteria bacterium]|nr:class II aldolase/adducin family protein [Alphaproteobacteria bacterium]
MPEVLDQTLLNLAVANRILEREGVVDAFGHASVRHPDNPDRYILSQSRSPGIVSRADLMEFTLDNEPVDRRDRPVYVERPIHGGIYESRPDVMSVIHNHSFSVIPFGVTGVPLRQIVHVAGGIGGEVPVWDIRKKFGDTNLLVTTREQGLDLAAALGGGNVALMRGHGCVVAAESLERAVLLAIYLEANARILLNALQLGGDVVALSPGEIEQTTAMTAMPLVAARTWDYWRARANLDGI